MEIKIKDLKQYKLEPTNVFKFKIKLMGGDGDAYFYPEVIVKRDHPYLKRFLTFLNDCKNLYPWGKGGYEDYTCIPDFWLFCSENYPGDITPEEKLLLDKELEEANDLRFYWEGSEEFLGVSSYKGCTVTYIDEDRYEYECEIVE